MFYTQFRTSETRVVLSLWHVPIVLQNVMCEYTVIITRTPQEGASNELIMKYVFNMYYHFYLIKCARLVGRSMNDSGQ